jgi:hypothetical protein
MATIKNLVLGYPKGRAGDIIFKIRNGKPYFSLKPSIYKRKESKALQKVKEDFAAVSALASAILSVKIFRPEWEGYNMIVKMNYPGIKERGTIENVILVPGEGEFILAMNSFNLSNNGIDIEISPFEEKYPYGTIVSLQGIMHLSDPDNKVCKKHHFLPLVSKSYDYKNAATAIEIIFTSQDIEIMSRYNQKKILLNAALNNHRSGKTTFSEKVYM